MGLHSEVFFASLSFVHKHQLDIERSCVWPASICLRGGVEAKVVATPLHIYPLGKEPGNICWQKHFCSKFHKSSADSKLSVREIIISNLLELTFIISITYACLTYPYLA